MKRKLNAIIIDDETPARDILKGLLNLQGSVNIAAEAADANEGIKQIIEYSPDIIFLDIEMPGINGIELMDNLKNLNLNPFVIFTTAHPDFAIEAIDRSAFGYLVKPVDQKKLNHYLNRIQCINKEETTPTRLSFPTSKGYLILDTKELIYALADGNYTHLHLHDGSKYTITLQLGKLKTMLDCINFVRINRSSIINSQFLKFIDRQKSVCILKFSNQKVEIPVSKSMVKDLLFFQPPI